MEIKESPIKQTNSIYKRSKGDYSDMSYINKEFNITPKSKQVSQLSPKSMMSELID